MKNRLNIAMILLASLLATAALGAEEGLREALREQVFADAQQALGAANDARASVLAPETYRSGANAFKKAEAAFNDDADLDRVRRHLQDAQDSFARAAELAVVVKEFVSAAYQARLDALNAGADARALELWQEAELQFYEATSRAELGRESRVGRMAEKAEKLFREAELAAIETVLFQEVETQIRAAKSLDADDWAPSAYRFAVDLLNQARTELTDNRYDTDRPRDLANQALHYAKHAQYIARLADDIDDNDTSLEVVLQSWEDAIQGLAVDLDQPVYFDTGPQPALDQLRAEVASRTQQLEQTRQSLANSEGRARILEEELLLSQVALEGQEKAASRLDQRLAEEEQRNAKLRRVEAMFTPAEAQVLREQNKLIIRLVGLGFSSGSANLETRHYPLLAKLQKTLAEFPGAPITIEGHTDNYGVDTTNMQLSVERAEAVASYLLANTSLSPANISSLGYGEARPVANNETAEGRARNRRIDVVFYP